MRSMPVVAVRPLGGALVGSVLGAGKGPFVQAGWTKRSALPLVLGCRPGAQMVDPEPAGGSDLRRVER
jgi:hypothetical protein